MSPDPNRSGSGQARETIAGRSVLVGIEDIRPGRPRSSGAYSASRRGRAAAAPAAARDGSRGTRRSGRWRLRSSPAAAELPSCAELQCPVVAEPRATLEGVADADLGRLGRKDVGAVAGALHPGGDDLVRARLATGQVLGQEEPGIVASRLG